jgi:phage tail sheath protein FI
VTDAETDLLIRRGVNPLRINTAGAVVLASAQTTAVDETWRPLQVVRTMFMIERAVTIGTRWTTFSPNREETWAEIRAQIEEYLTTLWRRGVLSGRSAEEAFLVRCDATTMTQHDIDAGRIHILVGLAFADNRLRAPGLIELRAQALGGDGNLRTYSVPDH